MYFKYEILVQLLFLLVILLKPKTDAQYCSRELCGNKRHIACNNNGNFASNCPSNARMVNIRRYRTLILNVHNTFRNRIAGGRVGNYRSAQRMATMRWNRELSYLAGLNVKRCRMQHDQCRNTNRFQFSGQNLALLSWSGNRRRNIGSTLRTLIGNFIREYRNANMNIIRSYRSSRGGKYGHFTTMVNDKNTHIGCSAVQYRRGRMNTLVLGCNYARTNIQNNPVYIAGNTASGCQTGRNRRYPNLCSTNEIYDVNTPEIYKEKCIENNN